MRAFPFAKLELSTSLPAGELVVALRLALCLGPPPLGWKAADVLAGEVTLERVRLTALPRAEDRGLFVTGQFTAMHDLEGRIVPDAGGALLRGELRLRPRWRWQVAAFLYGPAALLGALTVAFVASSVLRHGSGWLPWTTAPGHAVSRLLEVAFRPAAAACGTAFLAQLVMRAGLERERRVVERILSGAISAAESAAAGKAVEPSGRPRSSGRPGA